MRRFGLLLMGILLIGAAAGAFTYRQMLTAEKTRSATETMSKAAPVRTVLMRGSEISYPVDHQVMSRDPALSTRPGLLSPGLLSPSLLSIEMFNFVFNLLNVIVGVLGIWFASQSMRAAPRRELG